jgi:Major intrinsic protein
MFDLHWYSFSSHARHGWAVVFSEFVATFGLLSVVWGCSRLRSNATPFAVASYITAAYWFTASTSFANPAVTIARSFSNTFAGIRPADAPSFIAAQFAGALAATFLFRWLVPNLPDFADEVIVPHKEKSARDGELWRSSCQTESGQWMKYAQGEAGSRYCCVGLNLPICCATQVL